MQRPESQLAGGFDQQSNPITAQNPLEDDFALPEVYKQKQKSPKLKQLEMLRNSLNLR